MTTAWQYAENWLTDQVKAQPYVRTLMVQTADRLGLLTQMKTDGVVLADDSIASGSIGDFIRYFSDYVCPSGDITKVDIDKLIALKDKVKLEYESDKAFYDNDPVVKKSLQILNTAIGMANGTVNPDDAVALLKEGGGALVDAGGAALDNMGFTDPTSRNLRSFGVNVLSGGWKWFQEKVGGMSTEAKRIAGTMTAVIGGIAAWKAFGWIPILGTAVKAGIAYLGYMLVSAKDAHGQPFVDGLSKNLFGSNVPGGAAAPIGQQVDPGALGEPLDTLSRPFNRRGLGAGESYSYDVDASDRAWELDSQGGPDAVRGRGLRYDAPGVAHGLT